MGVRLTRYAAALTSSIVVFAVIAGGCGGGGEDEAREVLDSYLAASERGDVAGICELWTPAALRDSLNLFGAGSPGDGSCDGLATGTPMGTFSLQTPDDAEISVASSEDGVVVFEIEGVEGGIEVQEIDGEWKLNSLCVASSCQGASDEPLEAPTGD